MPTVEVNTGDRIKFLTSQGALASEFDYDENNGQLVLQDSNGDPADQKVGALEATTINDAEVAKPNGKSIQTAINDAGAGGHVIIKQGTYNEQNIGIANEQTVKGLGNVIIDGGSAECISSTGDGCVLRNVNLNTTNTTAIRVNGVDDTINNIVVDGDILDSQNGKHNITNCRVQSGAIIINNNDTSVSSCHVNGSINDFGSNNSIDSGSNVIY